MKLKTNKNKNNNHKNMKSKLNNKNKNFKNGTKLRKNKTKSNLRGGFNPNPLKLLSFYFYKLISKAVLLNKDIKTQLDTLEKNIPQKLKTACAGKNIRTQIINICINILQSISIIGFVMSNDKDNYINNKLQKMKNGKSGKNNKKTTKTDCKSQIIAYLLVANKQGTSTSSITKTNSKGKPLPKGDFTKFMSSIGNVAEKDKGKLLETLTNDPNVLNQFKGQDGKINTSLLSESSQILNKSLTEAGSNEIKNIESELEAGLLNSKNDTMLNKFDMISIDNTLPAQDMDDGLEKENILEAEKLKPENEPFNIQDVQEISSLDEEAILNIETQMEQMTSQDILVEPEILTSETIGKVGNVGNVATQKEGGEEEVSVEKLDPELEEEVSVEKVDPELEAEEQKLEETEERTLGEKVEQKLDETEERVSGEKVEPEIDDASVQDKPESEEQYEKEKVSVEKVGPESVQNDPEAVQEDNKEEKISAPNPVSVKKELAAVGGTYKKRKNKKSKQNYKSKKHNKSLKNRKSKSNNSKKQKKH